MQLMKDLYLIFFVSDDLKFWKKAPKNVNIIQFILDYFYCI